MEIRVAMEFLLLRDVPSLPPGEGEKMA
jgi:hypothetical protein